MFVGSCSIVISGLLLANGTKNRPFDCRIGSILIKKIPPSTVCFWLGFQQKKNLLFFRYFNEFLMAHHRQVAREIRDEYIDTMSKIYFSYFKTYISKLLKLQVSVLRPNRDFTLDTQTPIWASFFRINSVGRALACWAGGRGFNFPRPDQYSGSSFKSQEWPNSSFSLQNQYIIKGKCCENQ